MPVEPLRWPAEAGDPVPERMQSLQVRRGVELPSQGSLAQVVPLGEEPGPLVEALDLLPAELVHQGLKGRVGGQDRERGEPLVLTGSPGHVVGQPQEPSRVGYRKSLGGHIR